MKEIRISELSRDVFEKYGNYSHMLDPEGPHLGAEPCEFYRDRVVMPLNSTNISFSITRVSKRPLIIEDIEYHADTAEAILPLDGDILIHIAPATINGNIPLESLEVFLIKQGTLVLLRPGVWHSGPFCIDKEHVNILVALPERTYANDCATYKIPHNQQIRIIQDA